MEQPFSEYPLKGLSPVRYFSVADQTQDEAVCQQAAEVRRLPGVLEVAVLASPLEDVAPSSVVLTRNRVVPAAIGLDIGCGATLLQLDLTAKDLSPQDLERFKAALMGRIAVPEGPIPFGKSDMQGILRSGASWVARAGFMAEDDLSRLEFTQLSTELSWNDSPQRAKQAMFQIGTLGRGGHFLALVEVKQGDPLSKKFGLLDGRLAILVHSGSRDYGRAIAETSLNAIAQKQSLDVNPAFASTDADSPEGLAYRRGHSAAANYALANRLLILFQAREILTRQWGCKSWLLGDHCHNLLSSEVIAGQACFVHRKGATRSYPSGHHNLQETIWEDVGQIVIPAYFDPETGASVRVATQEVQQSFYSMSPFGPEALATQLANLRPLLVIREP